MSLFEKLWNSFAENWKTTATGIVASVAIALNDLGLIVSPELQGKATAWLIAAGLLILGIFSKDGDTPPTAPTA